VSLEPKCVSRFSEFGSLWKRTTGILKVISSALQLTIRDDQLY
jgi:hypothetical protein